MIFEIISETIQEGMTEVGRRRREHEGKEGRGEEGGTACNGRNSCTDKNVRQLLLKMMTYAERYITIIVTTEFKFFHENLVKTEKYTLFKSQETIPSILKLRDILSTHF